VLLQEVEKGNIDYMLLSEEKRGALQKAINYALSGELRKGDGLFKKGTPDEATVSRYLKILGRTLGMSEEKSENFVSFIQQGAGGLGRDALKNVGYYSKKGGFDMEALETAYQVYSNQESIPANEAVASAPEFVGTASAPDVLGAGPQTSDSAPAPAPIAPANRVNIESISGGIRTTTEIEEQGRQALRVETDQHITREDGISGRVDQEVAVAHLSNSEISRTSTVYARNLVQMIDNHEIKNADQFCNRLSEFKGSNLSDLERESAERQFETITRTRFKEARLRTYLTGFLSKQDAGSLPRVVEGIETTSLPSAVKLPEGGRLVSEGSAMPISETPMPEASEMPQGSKMPEGSAMPISETILNNQRIIEIDKTLQKFAETATGDTGAPVRASLVLEIGQDNISDERLTQILKKAENASLNDLSNWEEGDLRTYKDILDAIFKQRQELGLTNRPDVVRKFEQAREFVESILNKK